MQFRGITFKTVFHKVIKISISVIRVLSMKFMLNVLKKENSLLNRFLVAPQCVFSLLSNVNAYALVKAKL